MTFYPWAVFSPFFLRIIKYMRLNILLFLFGHLVGLFSHSVSPYTTNDFVTVESVWISLCLPLPSASASCLAVEDYYYTDNLLQAFELFPPFYFFFLKLFVFLYFFFCSQSLSPHIVFGIVGLVTAV